jgi:integrase
VKVPPGLYKRPDSDIWWCSYSNAGRRVRESTGTADLQDAKRFLDERKGRIATGQPVIPRAEKVRYDELAEDLRAHYRTTEDRNLVEVEKRLKHLDAFFKGWPAVAIDSANATRYVERRQTPKRAADGTVIQPGAANGTINRELAILGRMLRLAHENGKLLRVPVIRKLKEAAPRSGFFEEEQFEWVKKRLPDDLQLAVTIAYTYGWRMQSEVLALDLRHLDLVAGTLRLDPGMTKNDEGRVVYLTPELKAQLAAHVERIRALERKLKRVIPYLFPYFDDTPHLSPRLIGTRRRDFRKAWLTVCKAAGVPGRLRHDFRRTAARNLVRRGVSERVAMSITGHRTRSVFDRYNIVNDADLRDAARRISATSAP